MVWARTLVLVHSIASDDEASPVVFDRWLFSWQSAKAFDALLRSGSDQIAWRDDYCGGFFCSVRVDKTSNNSVPVLCVRGIRERTIQALQVTGVPQESELRYREKS